MERARGGSGGWQVCGNLVFPFSGAMTGRSPHVILLAPGPVVQHSPAQVNLHLPAKTCRPPDPFTALLVPDYSAGDLPNRDLDPGLARAGCGWELLIDFSVWGRSEVIYSTRR